MKLDDIRELNKDDILSAIGLARKTSATTTLLTSLGIFGVGLLVGAGTALLLATQSGEDLREDLGQRLKDLRGGPSGSHDNDDKDNVDANDLSAGKEGPRDGVRT